MTHPILPASSDALDACVGWMCASEPFVTLGFDAARCRRAVDAPGSRWMAVVGDDPVGIALVRDDAPLGPYLSLLCVAPHHRGNGVGTALMDFVESRAFAAQPDLFLCVSSCNAAAQGFYSRRGYRRAGVLEDFLKPGLDEWLMRKNRNWKDHR